MKKFEISDYQMFFEEPLMIGDATTWIEHIPFLFLLIEMLKPSTIVELGAHTGTSFAASCQAVQALRLKTKCYAVDTWEGDEHVGYYGDIVFRKLSQYIFDNYSSFAQLMRMTFDDASRYFNDGSIDLLHIDGLHTYDAVKHDFDTWITRMSDRGIIIMHDTFIKKDDFGVWKLWEEISDKYRSYNFNFGCGLGILAVGANVPDEIIDFIKSAKNSIFLDKFFGKLGSNLLFKDNINKLRQDINQLGADLNKAKGELFLVRSSRTWRWGSRITDILHALFFIKK